MTTFREEIEKKCAENAKMGPCTAKFARALNIVINTSLKGGSGFILELIQNAEDAGATEVEVRLVNGYLILEHNGKPFSQEDIKEVCDFGHDQDTSKAENNQKIGYKGIGFKAVFSVSDQVYIVTPQGTFGFNKAYFKEMKDIPWQVCPIYIDTNELPTEFKQSQQGHQTTIALKLKPNLKLTQEMQYLNDNPEILLFLNHITKLQLQFSNTSSQLAVSKTSNLVNTHTVTLKRDNKEINRWFVMSTLVKLDEKAITTLKDPNKDSTEYPDRMRTLETTLVQFAAQLSNEGYLQSCTGQFYAGLPTQVKTNALPVLVNAPNLLLDASRKQLQENEWNQYLLTLIPQLLVNWMQTLAQLPEYRIDVLSLLPMPEITTSLPPSLQASYKTGMNSAKNTKCIPMFSGETAIVDAWIDESGFMLTFPQFSKRNYTHPNLNHRKRLEDFHLIHSSSNHVWRFSDIWPQLDNYFGTDLSMKFQQELWRFIVNQTLGLGTSLPNALVNKLRVLGMDGILHSLNGEDILYLPSEEVTVFKEIVQFPLVHPALYYKAGDIELFLRRAGVFSVSPIHIIHQHLLPALEKNTHPEQNVAMLTYIFKHFNFLNLTEINTLKKAHVKNTKGEYLPLSLLYLGDIYEPEISLELVVPNASCFIAADYLATPDIPWKQYFIQLGAAENFKARLLFFTQNHAEIVLGHSEHAKAFQTKQFINSTVMINTYAIPMIELITHSAYSVAIWQAIEAHARHNPSQSGFIKFYLQNAPSCLASDGKHYPSLSLLSESVSPLIKTTLPFAALPVKTDEYPLKHFLEMRVELTVSEWLQVLNTLNNTKSLLVEHYTQVLFGIYCLARGPDKKKAEVKAALADWQGLLLAENGSLQSVKELKFYNTDNFIMSPTERWLQRMKDNHETAIIAELFNIPQIHDQSYKLNPKNGRPDKITKARLTDPRSLSLLAFVEYKGKQYDHPQTVNDLRLILSYLEFIVADEISITQKYDESGKVLQTTDFVNQISGFTYTHSASSPFVVRDFANALKKKLGFENPHMERILTMFISYDYPEFARCLEQFGGYNQADIPNPKIPKDKKEQASKQPEPRIFMTFAAAKQIYEAQPKDRTKKSPAEKARLFQFINNCKLGPNRIILEGDFMDFADIVDQVKLFVLQEVKHYDRGSEAHAWGIGTVFQHLIQHYMGKFSLEKKAEMQSKTHIIFVSKNHRKLIEVQWFKNDGVANNNNFDGDIRVTKRTFNETSEMISEKVNEISVKAKKAPKPEVAVNPNLHWIKNRKEVCQLAGNKNASKQLQTSWVKVKF